MSTRRHEPLHLPPETHLPAVPESTPAVDMLKQLLEQMLENERRRLRNEYIRISVLFLILLALATGSGWWLAHSLLGQLRQERQKNQSALALPHAGLSDQPPLIPDGNSPLDQVPDKNQLLENLRKRAEEASNLQKRLEQIQNQAIATAALETETFPEQALPGGISESAAPPEAPASVTITTSNHLILRLPIPKP